MAQAQGFASCLWLAPCRHGMQPTPGQWEWLVAERLHQRQLVQRDLCWGYSYLALCRPPGNLSHTE